MSEAALAKLPASEAPAAPAAAAFVAGARVFLERLGAEGVLAQPPDARGRAKVTVGKMTVEVGVDELRAAVTSPRRAVRAASAVSRPSPPAPDDALALVSSTTARTVDLRGQTGDEALAAVEAALDRAALAGDAHVLIVHGHGTGALRKRVRAYLAESPYVARFAPGAPRQGGDGVSVVELR